MLQASDPAEFWLRGTKLTPPSVDMRISAPKLGNIRKGLLKRLNPTGITAQVKQALMM